MPESIGPAIARERLRAALRKHREDRGLSSAAVGERLSWPASALDELESGARLPSVPEAEALAEVYGLDRVQAERLVLLGRLARSRSWWSKHGMTDEHQDFVAYESEASRISVYQPLVVPGLLQTRRYAVAATATILRRSADDPDVAARVQLRVERQRMVADRVAGGEPVHLVAVLDEIVLRRVIGGDDVMREQLDRLVAEARNDHVSLVIMPTRLGGHAGLGGVFELLEIGDDADLSTVFLESVASDHLVRGPRVTAIYRQIVADLVSSGCGGDDAIALLHAISDEIGS